MLPWYSCTSPAHLFNFTKADKPHAFSEQPQSNLASSFNHSTIYNKQWIQMGANSSSLVPTENRSSRFSQRERENISHVPKSFKLKIQSSEWKYRQSKLAHIFEREGDHRGGYVSHVTARSRAGWLFKWETRDCWHIKAVNYRGNERLKRD